MKHLLIIILMAFILIGCSKDKNDYTSCRNGDDDYTSCPECVQDFITETLNKPRNPRFVKNSVDVFRYKNNIVYVYGYNFPDATTMVFNEDCEMICYFGGFGGPKVNSCENWEEDAKFIENLWTDNR